MIILLGAIALGLVVAAIIAGGWYLAVYRYMPSTEDETPPEITCSICGGPMRKGPGGYWCERCEVER